MTHDILSLPLTQLMKSQDQPATLQCHVDVGAPGPTSAPCETICGSAEAPSLAPSQS